MQKTSYLAAIVAAVSNDKVTFFFNYASFLVRLERQQIMQTGETITLSEGKIPHEPEALWFQ